MMNHLRGRLPIVWNIHRLNDFSKSHRTSKYRNLIDFIFRLQPLKKYLGFRATSFQIFQPHSYVFVVFFVLLPYGGIPYWQSCRCDWLGCCDVCWLTKPAITNTIRHWLALMKPAQTIIVEDRASPPLFSISSSWETAEPSKVKNPDLDLSWQDLDDPSQDNGFDPPPTPNLGLFAKQIHSESKSLGGRRGNEVYHTWALLLGYANRRQAQGWNSSITRNDQNMFHFLGQPCGPEKIQYRGQILIIFAAHLL